MTPRIVQRRRARADVLEQIRYIAADNPTAARAFYASFEATLDLLGEQPRMGRVYGSSNRRTTGIRVLPVRGFPKMLIFYRYSRGCIDVIRVLHAARHIPPLLGKPEP